MRNKQGVTIILTKFLFCSLCTLVFLGGYFYLSYKQQTSISPAFTTLGCTLLAWYTVIRTDHIISNIKQTNQYVHKINNLTLTTYKWNRYRRSMHH